MSSNSELVDSLKILQLSGCTPIVIITIVGYDYLLTFTREVNAVWCRPWTWVSTLFVVARYIGLSWTVALALAGNVMLPGPIEIGSKGIVVLEIGDWGYLLFLAAADMVMILRVYAMWDRSTKILGVLLAIYVPQILVIMVWEFAYVFPGKTATVSIDQVLNYKSCNYSTPMAPPATYKAIPQFVLGSTMLILAIVPTLSHMIEMYKLTKRWEINRLLELLVREGTVYFVVNVLFNIVNAIHISDFNVLVPLDALCYALTCVIIPRFIIDIRELYDSDRTNKQGMMDTGFGISFKPGSTTINTRGTTTWGNATLEGSREYSSGAIELEEMKWGEWHA